MESSAWAAARRGQGSRKPARLLMMRWKGSDVDPIAFVGKGVTFDTGGISIKAAAAWRI